MQQRGGLVTGALLGPEHTAPGVRPQANDRQRDETPANPLFTQDRPWETHLTTPTQTWSTPRRQKWRLAAVVWKLCRRGICSLQLFRRYSVDQTRPWALQVTDKQFPGLAHLGTHNNIMFGGGLGMYRDLHEKD